MAHATQTPRKLSNVQAILLQMFETDLSENDLKEVKNLLSRFLFKKAEESAEKAMKKQGITVQEIAQEMHNNIENGSRTEYLKKLRDRKHEGSH